MLGCSPMKRENPKEYITINPFNKDTTSFYDSIIASNVQDFYDMVYKSNNFYISKREEKSILLDLKQFKEHSKELDISKRKYLNKTK